MHQWTCDKSFIELFFPPHVSNKKNYFQTGKNYVFVVRKYISEEREKQYIIFFWKYTFKVPLGWETKLPKF